MSGLSTKGDALPASMRPARIDLVDPPASHRRLRAVPGGARTPGCVVRHLLHGRACRRTTHDTRRPTPEPPTTPDAVKARAGIEQDKSTRGLTPPGPHKRQGCKDPRLNPTSWQLGNRRRSRTGYPAVYLPRYAERRNCGPRYHEPPRNTRRPQSPPTVQAPPSPGAPR